MYHKYARTDFFETNEVKNAIIKSAKLKRLDLKALFATIGSETLFSLTKDDIKILESIGENLFARELDASFDAKDRSFGS
mmetsp:Transcript_28460/g.35153  ORF Transcript_28460/g.35153 Transcript_28460/m.35153 type:complete len:80 (+) Transcript_28460:318-557(+)